MLILFLYNMHIKKKTISFILLSIEIYLFFFLFKFVYIIGQIIGSIEFFKGFMNTNLNQFKLDKLIVSFKPFCPQYTLVIVIMPIYLYR